MKFILSTSLAVLMLASLVAWNVNAGDGSGCCPQCGCNNLTAVCRVVPVVTKVPKVEYSCKCGDICVPGKSICVGTECVTDCNGNTCQQKVYEPCCGKVYSTVTPGKTTTMVEKCTYKCVVEYVCGKCGCGAGGGPTYAPAGAAAPNGTHPDPGHPPYWHRSN
jgi:hypothetical protein